MHSSSCRIHNAAIAAMLGQSCTTPLRKATNRTGHQSQLIHMHLARRQHFQRLAAGTCSPGCPDPQHSGRQLYFIQPLQDAVRITFAMRFSAHDAAIGTALLQEFAVARKRAALGKAPECCYHEVRMLIHCAGRAGKCACTVNGMSSCGGLIGFVTTIMRQSLIRAAEWP